ncbi:MAG: YihA family ribosome biogenesis GTP-binding protein [Neisseriaceae bacterium]|nr:MAG: YihA family ribosome biogenesis GTP-binding protein [Neisseriaceae bacterium]
MQYSNFFRETKFFTTVNYLKDLPIVDREIAFVGRSNAGKSSVINILTGRNRLAYVSKTPGRTQHINYFQLKNGDFMVDLPGYGYAAVPESVRKHWVDLLGNYLVSREAILGLVMIMDSRHPLKELDKVMLDFFFPRRLPVHILLSKADKLSRQEQMRTLFMVKKALQSWLSDGMQLSVQLFSSLKKTGIEEVEEIVGSWFEAD